MILTRTHLNVRRQGAKKLLGSPQAMHAAILSGFTPGVDPGRPLWRVDPDDPLRPTLYILSEHRPDLVHLEEQAGWPSQPTTQSRSYDPLLEGLQPGQTWAFRLRANPTHRAAIPGRPREDGRSKVVAHVTVAQQTGWFHQRAPMMGVDLGPVDEPTFHVTAREAVTFKRGGMQVTLGAAVFEGVLTVVDPLALRTSLVGGIGRAKAYGCGLMTLERP